MRKPIAHPDLKIRSVVVGDVTRLVALYHRAYAENARIGFPASAGEVSEREVLEWARNDQVFVAATSDELLGAVRLRFYPQWQRMVLGRLAVDPTAKRSGLGARLMEHAEDHAFRSGWTEVRLTAPSGHPFLPGWYLRRGYRQVGTRDLPHLPYDETIFEKRLDDRA